jgi:hypothetical protein
MTCKSWLVALSAALGACSPHTDSSVPSVSSVDGSSAEPTSGSSSGSGGGGLSSGAAGNGTGSSGGSGSGGSSGASTGGSSSSSSSSSGGPSVNDAGAVRDASMAGSEDGGVVGASDGGSGTHNQGSDAATSLPPGCTLPTTVSFNKDVQPFLATSCGNRAGGSGCHVLDATSTVASGGYDHAYDWITGTAHASSCPESPTPFRFQVVMAVVDQSFPPTCSKSPQMPLADATGVTRAPLTACQKAALQSWLDEPFVTQTHRDDSISPLTPYPMPPFN